MMLASIGFNNCYWKERFFNVSSLINDLTTFWQLLQVLVQGVPHCLLSKGTDSGGMQGWVTVGQQVALAAELLLELLVYCRLYDEVARLGTSLAQVE